MKVQLRTATGQPMGDVLPDLPWRDFAVWQDRVFRRLPDEEPGAGARVQNFQEVDVIYLTSGGRLA